MTLKRLSHTLAACLLLLAAPALARDLTPDEQSGLEDRIARFEQAFEQGDMDAVLTVVPPKVISSAADTYGLTEPQVLAAMKQAMINAMAAVTVEEYEIDLAAATTGETASGRVYVLIPTTTLIRVGEQDPVRSDTVTLAFRDDGTWYLVRIDDEQQVASLTAAYPEFDGVDLIDGDE
ncbi:MAG: hypothetical protein RIA08_10150 [Roseovarius sp.]|uniref:hypothetical protein n=1 Tax=Roseobacteraceae TaxID=2854170 RepID=UPI0032EDA2DF